MIIYKATNLVNGKVYIGQTVNTLKRRQVEHKSQSKKGNFYFHRALRKHGIDNFSWEVLRLCDNLKSLNAWEQYYILYYNTMGNGYNLTSGGMNYTRTKEMKLKMSQNHSKYWKGKKFSKEHRQKISKTNLNKKVSKKSRKKMSENNAKYWKGKHRSEKTKKKMSKNSTHHWLGKPKSEETKRKISISKSNPSDETRKKMSDSTKGKNHPNWGKPLSEKTKQRISNAQKNRWKNIKEKINDPKPT